MKKLAAILCLSALTTGAFGQGLVTFLNTSTTLSSATVNGTSAATSGAPGAYFYALLLAPAGTTDPKAFTFPVGGLYATNIAAAGRFNGGANLTAAGWAAGTSMSYEIAIWSSSLGHDFVPGWLQGQFGTASGVFGLSSIATGISGGAGSPASPAYNLFGGATGISTGFNANPTGAVPEPTSMALAGLGAAALLIFRRRK
jgi:hypothetical protein